MTFNEYNTDANYNNKDSNLEELVNIGKSEGMTLDSIKKALSPSWQKSRYIDSIGTYYYKPEEKEEPKKSSITTTEISKPTVAKNTTVEPEKKVSSKKETEIKTSDDNYLKETNAIVDEALNSELENQREFQEQSWDDNDRNAMKMGEAFTKIDDKMIKQLPTFMTKRYADGEFGDPKGWDAKLRLAHFMINGLQSQLKNASNAAALAAGRSPMFADTKSDYQKYQETNLAQGLENRWNKYKTETNAAMKLAENQGIANQDIQNGLRQIASNRSLQTAFNMMDAKQKLYLMNIAGEIGDKVGNFDNEELVNFMIGKALSGDMDWEQAAAIAISKALPVAVDAIENGGVNAGMPKKEQKKEEIGSDKFFGGGSYTTIDGNEVSFDAIENKEGKEKLRALMDDLSSRFYNEQIDAATFEKFYTPLYKESKKHSGTGSFDAKTLIKKNTKNRINDLNLEFNNLNKSAKAGEITPEDYILKFNALAKSLKYWDPEEKYANDKQIEKLRLSSKDIMKYINKKNKK